MAAIGSGRGPAWRSGKGTASAWACLDQANLVAHRGAAERLGRAVKLGTDRRRCIVGPGVEKMATKMGHPEAMITGHLDLPLATASTPVSA